MIKDKKGSLTLEATIVLTLTICLVVTIIFFTKLVYVHTVVQHALTQTSKEISTYMYVARMIGAADFNEKFNVDIGNAVAEADVRLDGTLGEAINTYNSAMDTYASGKVIVEEVTSPGGGSIDNILNELESGAESLDNAITSGSNTIENTTAYLSDPRQVAEDVGAILLDATYEEAKSLLLGKLAKAMMAKYLSTPDKDAHENLLSASVVGGFNGLNFRGCSLLNNSNGSVRKIEIVVAYDMEFKLPFQFMDRVTIVQKAASGAWIGD